MPWCDDCDRFLNPNTVRDDGTCPTCGAPIASRSHLRRARRGRGATADAMAVRASQPDARQPATEADESAEQTSAPWHFWVLVVALVIYLGWRLIQGIVWVAHRF